MRGCRGRGEGKGLRHLKTAVGKGEACKTEEGRGEELHYLPPARGEGERGMGECPGIIASTITCTIFL